MGKLKDDVDRDAENGQPLFGSENGSCRGGSAADDILFYWHAFHAFVLYSLALLDSFSTTSMLVVTYLLRLPPDRYHEILNRLFHPFECRGLLMSSSHQVGIPTFAVQLVRQIRISS